MTADEIPQMPTPETTITDLDAIETAAAKATTIASLRTVVGQLAAVVGQLTPDTPT